MSDNKNEKNIKKEFNHNYAIVIFLYIWATIFLVSASGIEDTGSKIFPYAASIGAIVMATILLVKNIFNIGKKETFDFKGTSKAVKYFVLLISYITLAAYAGYYIATPIYLIFSMRALGQKNNKMIILSTLVVMVFVYLFFDLALDMKIPTGILFN